MKISRLGVGAVGALMLSIMSAQGLAAPAAAQTAANGPSPKADDVPAPPAALLFGMAAVGLFWGRRLAATARKGREEAKPGE